MIKYTRVKRTRNRKRIAAVTHSILIEYFTKEISLHDLIERYCEQYDPNTIQKVIGKIVEGVGEIVEIALDRHYDGIGLNIIDKKIENLIEDILSESSPEKRDKIRRDIGEKLLDILQTEKGEEKKTHHAGPRGIRD